MYKQKHILFFVVLIIHITINICRYKSRDQDLCDNLHVICRSVKFNYQFNWSSTFKCRRNGSRLAVSVDHTTADIKGGKKEDKDVSVSRITVLFFFFI